MLKTKNRVRGKNSNKEPTLSRDDRLQLHQRISQFLAGSDVELVIPGLSNVQRKYLHKYIAHLGLLSRSYGPESNRVLHITHRKRLKSLGHVRKLELSAASRSLLEKSLPVFEAHVIDANRVQHQQISRQQLQKKSRLRSESLLIGLGSRLVPPRANRISSELYRDKQELPIYLYQEEIHNMLKQHAIFIISGETGSGKTTQVPQYILNDSMRRNRPCRLVVTQPRRVAAVSVAHRVAEERGEQIGDTVGYQIRLESRVQKTTNLIYTTSGCLLRSIMADAKDFFRKVTHLIIDEIHERDKYTDFTLITIKEQLKHDKDLKVILMSATMDISLLSKYFNDCPVMSVPGQGFNVKIFQLEDILYRTGYRTALMEKYLRSMNESNSPQYAKLPASVENNSTYSTETPAKLSDVYLQKGLDAIIDQCCLENFRCEEELLALFDQMQYFIESEGMPVDAAHSQTGITPLMAACKCNYAKYVELFLFHQANVHLRDARGLTALDYSKMHSDETCLRILQSSDVVLKEQMQLKQELENKQRILLAYQQQFNDENEVDHDLILSLLEGLYRSPHPGAIMVFLPGYNDIVQQRDLIQSTLPANTYRICILHGQMDSQDQFEALQRHTVRKIILSTNIGQTSITVPDLAYIIDSGKVKMKTHDSITESSQLQSVWISKADANQRSGRAGRTQNGVCYRLYSTATYEYMPEFCIPEFMRIPLTEICLYAKTLDRQSDVSTFLARALNPPSSVSVQNAVRKLQMLEVFNDDESVTELGRHLVEIPLDVQLGKCLLYGIFFKCFDSILTIVAFHSVKDPFILPTDRAAQGHASFQRKSFAGKTFSDQLGILSLYKSYCSVRNNRKRVREFCNKYYLSQSAMEVFCATRRQIADLTCQKFRLGQQASLFNDDWNMVRYCLAAGFYPNVAVIDRQKGTLISGAEKQLLLQRTSALNPPGMKNLKDFIDELPFDWVIFFEKSGVGSKCSINMNTVVSPVVIALQCGRDCVLDKDALDDSKISDNEESVSGNATVDSNETFNELMTKVEALSLPDPSEINNPKAIMSIDNWIKFELPTNDANMLLLLRSLIKSQFEIFLQSGNSMQASTSVYHVQKLLYSLENIFPT
ncbi:3'-5' RNA helicase YTHDC2 [Anastrepha ludens]|uniref:3'-5' RNA helicase YTHDC2 n=1 Tax=Anastrepha ludens TaxID=28586 RepID=UPI0023B08229|nr:3'-5' RNA helicase YTHDC2 [Anastrepha ludens]XP_053948088.1 3'-5' RNA helicase YTHDC2 [Anastrepha ludens]